MLSAHFPILFDRALVLRDMMKGKLDPEEWEPLICSSLIFYERFRWRRYIERLIALLPFLASFAFAIVSWIMYRFLGYPLPPLQVSAISLVALLISPFFPGLYSIRHLDRRLVLRADRRTAMVLGKERLLQVLEKVEAMRKADLSQGREDEWRDFMFVPKATERIKNLRGL
jgi:Zn-dependent protease with chaperone function